MEYSKIIDLDNVTLQDCIDIYEKKRMFTVVNDGHIENFIEDGE